MHLNRSSMGNSNNEVMSYPLNVRILIRILILIITRYSYNMVNYYLKFHYDINLLTH